MVTLNSVRIDPVEVSVEGETYDFVFGSYHIYAREFDLGRISRELLAGGYDYDVLQPMLNSAQEQYQALQGGSPGNAPAAKGKGKAKPEDSNDPEDGDDDPASA